MTRYGLILTAVAGLAGVLLATPAAGGSAWHTAPEWAACPADLVTAVPLECASVPVPLDYDSAGGSRSRS